MIVKKNRYIQSKILNRCSCFFVIEFYIWHINKPILDLYTSRENKRTAIIFYNRHLSPNKKDKDMHYNKKTHYHP